MVSAEAPAGPRFAGPSDAGLMAEPANREASGLAASRRTAGLAWVHNDSGGEPVLFAFDTAGGRLCGAVRLDGVTNDDWEDAAAFELDGKAWLLAADCGDNFAQRTQVRLHIIEEPGADALAPGQELRAKPAYTIHFIFEDGARDCESVAVDPRERMVYLLTKRDPVPRLYRLPLAAATATAPAVARKVGEVRGLPQPDAAQRLVASPLMGMRGWPCAMDFSADGRMALVLTYGDLLVFPRAEGEAWADALARAPLLLPPHALPQAEGACFTADGRHILVGSEKVTTFRRYDRREP